MTESAPPSPLADAPRAAMPNPAELLRSRSYVVLVVLCAIGSGMGVLAVHLIKRDAPEMASLVIGAAGSFAAIATLLGSPIAGAFLMMEAGGLGGPLMGMVLVPGLLAAGIGSLIYIGL